MSRRDKVVTLAVVGGILILLGVLTNSWWRVEGGVVKIGLREAKFCADGLIGGGVCFSVKYGSTALGSVDTLGLEAAFFRYAKLTYWVGLLAGFGLLGHAWLVRKREDHRAGYAAGAACVAVVILAIATVSAFPGELDAVADKGWSFWFTLIGCVLGAGSAIPKLIPTSAVAGARDAIGGIGNKIHHATLGPLADHYTKNRPDPKTVPKARIHKD